MSYVTLAVSAGSPFLDLKYGIKAVGAFVVSVGFIAMGAASLLPYRYQVAEPLVPALNSYWIYIHVSITLTSYAAFAMAGGPRRVDLPQGGAGGRGGAGRKHKHISRPGEV